tara:strand:- start:38812 stop:40542 length:1731 start_codon:yes stop_codon:yes gene_type:complete
MKFLNYYKKPTRVFPLNIWDGLALLLIFGLFAMLAYGARQMSLPFNLGQPIHISLDPHVLPGYALQSVLRMLIAMVISLLFTFGFGTLAAKNKHAERLIIPMIDILQSVPVLGFLSITIAGFIALFPGSMMGPECACIFAIFTAQTWNMTLGFYQSLKSVPEDLQEAAAMFHLTAWQKFWRVEVPLAMPSLIWNMMMSMSASWVFLVAAEAISVANQSITLPGIGSYIAAAVSHKDMAGILFAIIAMFVVIFIYDQILFRPLVKWSEKFRFEQNPDDKQTRSWVAIIMERAHLLKLLDLSKQFIKDMFINRLFYNRRNLHDIPTVNVSSRRFMIVFWYIAVSAIIIVSTAYLLHFIFSALPYSEAWLTFKLGCATLTRVLVSVLISSIIWVPIGVWIGMNPRLTQTIQPIIQFLAGFPANLLFPLVVMLILHFDLNVQIWVTPLMTIGSMWYILFNVVAGTSTLPKDYFYATDNFGVKGWLWWKRFILPGVFPYYITGAITAAGAAWNLSIIAEVIQWGHTKIVAYGLGAYISEYTTKGDFHRIALSIGMMCLFVLFFNRLVWKPLYKLAEERYGN